MYICIHIHRERERESETLQVALSYFVKSERGFYYLFHYSTIFFGFLKAVLIAGLIDGYVNTLCLIFTRIAPSKKACRHVPS